MRPIIPGLVAALLLASACTPKPSEPVRDPSITYGIPTPSNSPTPSPTPSRSASPSTEDLVRQTQAAYQTAFDEFERLSWAGGADEPSPRMQQVATGSYLEQISALLADQKRRGFTLSGEASRTKSRPSAGPASGIDVDPRLTLEVCEDRSPTFALFPDGRRIRSRIGAGHVYAKAIRGEVRLVHIDTEAVDKCGW